MEGVIIMKSLNGYEKKTDEEILISCSIEFIVELFILLFYVLLASFINFTLPFEVAVTFDILSVIVVLILAVVL